MENIDLFNQYTAQILAKLYKNFPKPIELDHADFASAFVGDNAWEIDDLRAVVEKSPLGEEPKKRTPKFNQQSDLAWHTIQWLRECDYIRTNENAHNDRRKVYKYVLSPKGLEALDAIPKSIDSKQTIGEQIVEGVGSAAGEAGRSALKELVGQVIGAATRSMLGAG